MSIGILNNSGLPQPMLLDAIRFAETGHLSPNKARTAVSPKGAQGPYQFLQKNLGNMGYGMPMNIPLTDVQDPITARQLAGQYITGFSNYHNFTTPLEMLVAYNMGPAATVEWKANGGRVEDLPNETQQYIRRAAQYIASAPTNEGNTQMAQMTEEEMARLAMADAMMGTQTIRRPEANTASADDGFFGPILSAINPISTAQAETMPATAAESKPALTMPQEGEGDPPVPMLGTFRVTGRRRDQSNMALPSTQIDNNELLMRVGLAGVGASAKGGLAAYQAMGDTYGAIMDANRANGLAAYQEMLANQGKAKNTSSEGQNVYSQAALDSINTIEQKVKTAASTWNPFDNVTGMIGNALSYVPGTEAHDVASQIDTIEAAVGFDRLQAMRDASPTGGSLGQVSDRELGLLKSSLGSLRQSQSREQFLKNLARVKKHYVGVINAFQKDGVIESIGSTPQPTNSSNIPDDVQDLVEKYK